MIAVRGWAYVLGLVAVAGCATAAPRPRAAGTPKPTAARAALTAVATAPAEPPPPAVPVDPAIDPVLGIPHAVGARVWMTSDACTAATCRVRHRVGAGSHVLGLRMARSNDTAPASVRARVVHPGGETALEIPADASRSWRTHRVPFVSPSGGEVEVEVSWEGEGVHVGWLEIGRDGRALALEPAGGVLREDAVLRIEHEEREGARLELRCGATEITAQLDDLIARGKARADDIGGRRLIRAPLANVAAACPGPRREITAALMQHGAPAGAGMITLLEREAACDFRGGGPTRVLLTGFAPMTALSETVNASATLVTEAQPPPGTAVMTLVLPVEWETAASWLLDAVERCRPDVVVAFGEGPGATVEVELEAYNRRDWAPVPDNRGLIRVDEPIADGGAEVLRARSPSDAIVRALRRRHIPARTIAMYRPFVCNEIFYQLLHRVAAPTPIAFVHVPMQTSGTALDRNERDAVLSVVVGETVTETGRSSTPAAP